MEMEGGLEDGMETTSPSRTPQFPSWLNSLWGIKVSHSFPRKGNLETRIRQDHGALYHHPW